mmetsp:Transcript_38107/g.89283  ORF Transcript_38107/g.89283 Transcript_38107/m.89283 type:complete len:80 (-) Transcript_38107:1619-1858(-)
MQWECPLDGPHTLSPGAAASRTCKEAACRADRAVLPMGLNSGLNLDQGRDNPGLRPASLPALLFSQEVHQRCFHRYHHL